MEFLGQQITVALLVSAVTSLIVSILSFSIGIRVGKERIDRVAVRATYRSLYQHFGEIEKSLLTGAPKQWDSYPLKGSQYFPMAKDMEASGELAMLPRRVASDVLELENGVLNCAWTFKKHIESVSPAIKDFLQQNLTGADTPINGASYAPIPIGTLLMGRGKVLDDALKNLTSSIQGIGIEYSLDRSRSSVCYIYPERLNSGTIAQLFNGISGILDKDVQGIVFAAELAQYDLRIKSLRNIIAARISDPHPFGETIKRSIPDMLKF